VKLQTLNELLSTFNYW